MIFILLCGIAVLQNQAVCGIKKFSGNFNAVSGFLTLFCVVFTRISVRFCGIGTPLTPPSVDLQQILEICNVYEDSANF